jgi:hypothetical protein
MSKITAPALAGFVVLSLLLAYQLSEARAEAERSRDTLAAASCAAPAAPADAK